MGRRRREVIFKTVRGQQYLDLHHPKIVVVVSKHIVCERGRCIIMQLQCSWLDEDFVNGSSTLIH